MKKSLFLFFSACIISSAVHAQLAIAKVVGKNAGQSKIGFGAFTYFDFPVNEEGTSSLRLELLDFAYFPRSADTALTKAYVSIKVGYKHIFSETRTGFYVEPQLGYCRVVSIEKEAPEATHGDGIAAAFEAGYSLEVGERGNTFNFGLKYETDRAGPEHTISSVGFRVSYSFNFFRRNNY